MAIKNFYAVLADVPIASSAALITVGLKSPIAANQRQKIRCWIPFTVGATGGVRAQIVVPAGGSVFHASILLVNTAAPSVTSAAQNSSAVFTNALANAGTHWLWIDAEITNGATAGAIDVQLAQNTSDALTLTVLTGGNMDATIY